MDVLLPSISPSSHRLAPFHGEPLLAARREAAQRGIRSAGFIARKCSEEMETLGELGNLEGNLL